MSPAFRLGISLIGMAGPGSGAWTRFEGLLPELRKRTDVAVAVLTDDVGFSERVEELAPETPVTTLPPFGRARRLLRLSGALEEFARSCSLDMIALEAPPVPKGVAVPTVLTIHDLRAFHRGQAMSSVDPEALNMRLLLGRSARRATGIVCVSHWTATDVVEHLGVPRSRVAVVPNPVAQWSNDMDHGASPPGSPIVEPFVLAFGHLERRKNLGVLAAATRSSEWPDGVALVLAGRDHGEASRLVRLADPSRLRMVGYVDDGLRRALLRDAVAVLVPSTLEGFGYSSLEAVASGTPSLVSDRGALPETVGTPDAVLPADRPDDWAAAVAGLIADPAGAERLLAAQREQLGRYAPERIAGALVEAHRGLLERT